MEREDAARADIPAIAFETPLEDINLAEHVYTILTEAEYRTAGDLMLAMKLDSNKVLGLAGIGPKAMQNIETILANLSFPEAETALEEAAPVEVQEEPQAEVAVVVAEVVEVAAEQPVESVAEAEVQTPAEAAPEETAEAETPSLAEIFALKPEVLKPQLEGEEDESDADKKEKKGKKKGVSYEFDEKLGEVVRRKKHKKEDGWEEEW